MTQGRKEESFPTRKSGTRFLACWLCVAGVAVCGVLLQACRGGGDGREAAASGRRRVELLVGAAQSLQGTIEAAGPRFEETHPGVTVAWTFASSGAVTQQILAGAPLDVCLSASDREMDRLEAAGRLLEGTRRELARNRMVLIAPGTPSARLPADLLAEWKDLERDEIRRVALGDPETVAAGLHADEILRHLGLRPAIDSKRILGANVRQVLDYVARGEVDAGVVFATDVAAARSPLRVVAPAPPGSHQPVRYPMAVVRDTRNVEAARAFVEFLASPEMQEMLEARGFLRADGG